MKATEEAIRSRSSRAGKIFDWGIHHDGGCSFSCGIYDVQKQASPQHFCLREADVGVLIPHYTMFFCIDLIIVRFFELHPILFYGW